MVVLDASDKNRTGSLKLCLYIDSLLTCSERPTEIVRKCWTQFRNVPFLSKKENKTEVVTQLLLVTPLYTQKLGNNVWELGDACDFHTAFVWLSWTWTDICQHFSGYSCSWISHCVLNTFFKGFITAWGQVKVLHWCFQQPSYVSIPSLKKRAAQRAV